MSSDLSALDDLVAGQDRGADLAIKHPVTGEPIGTLTIAGPDSDTQRRARLQMQDELYAFKGRPPAAEYDRMDIDRLARCVVSWRLKRAEQDVPFTFAAVVKLLREQPSVREQVERFSQDRAPYFLRLPMGEE
ncbi:MAG TPA: hypothetical protein VHC94_19150 [Nitrobacter sp.]|nr:hypothetical protein [Nitrobacter sp.]